MIPVFLMAVFMAVMFALTMKSQDCPFCKNTWTEVMVPFFKRRCNYCRRFFDPVTRQERGE